MTYEQYEKYIQKHFENELKETFNTAIEVKHQENLLTPTGREYNIDLNYKFKVGDAEYLTIVECKHWKNTITRDLILTLKEKAQELGAHKAILVTTKGFQSGAIEYALEKGVALVKMTPKGRKEVYSNFIGIDISNIITMLTTETDLSNEEKIESYTGLIFPVKTVDDYLRAKYGQVVVDTLNEFEKNPDNYRGDSFDENTRAIFKSIPNDWYNDYKNIETSGLDIKLFNERELRLYNVFIVLLKLTLDKL